MKKLILILIGIFILCSVSSANYYGVIARKNASAGYSLEQDLPGTKDNLDNSHFEPGEGASEVYGAGSFTTVGGYTITRACVKVDAYGTIGNSTIDFDVFIYDNGASVPNASIETSTTNTYDLASEAPIDDEWICFDFAGQVLAATTRYWFVIQNVGTTDTGDYIALHFDTSDTELCKYDTDAASWTGYDNTSALYIRTYSGGP